MTPEEKLQAQLADPYMVEVKARVESGDLKFVFGPENWRQGDWHDPYGRVSIPFALRMALARPEIKQFNIYYHKPYDFQHIEFECEGETYIVRWYKTYILCRKSDRAEIDFGRREYDITQAFARRLNLKDSPHWRQVGKTFDHFLTPDA